MNIDLLFPTLTGDLTKLPQADPAGSDGTGQEFEDMLVQQSKAQQENSRPQKKAEDKKAPEKPEQKSTQEDEATEKGGELAAALVTPFPRTAQLFWSPQLSRASPRSRPPRSLRPWRCSRRRPCSRSSP